MMYETDNLLVTTDGSGTSASASAALEDDATSAGSCGGKKFVTPEVTATSTAADVATSKDK